MEELTVTDAKLNECSNNLKTPFLRGQKKKKTWNEKENIGTELNAYISNQKLPEIDA